MIEKGKLCKAIHLDVPIFFLIVETGGTVKLSQMRLEPREHVDTALGGIERQLAIASLVGLSSTCFHDGSHLNCQMC